MRTIMVIIVVYGHNEPNLSTGHDKPSLISSSNKPSSNPGWDK